MTSVVQTENSTQPVDIATMRQTIGRLLPPDVEPVGISEVETLTSLLRGHMQLIIPEIEQAARGLPGFIRSASGFSPVVKRIWWWRRGASQILVR
ncbi:DUF6415 family natural product biosynthesis protein, partial [Streptomyces sp. NPDC002758]